MASFTISEGHPRSIVPIKGRHPSRWIRFVGGRYETIDDEEIAVLSKTPGVAVERDPDESSVRSLQRALQGTATTKINRAKSAGKTTGERLEGKARQVMAAAQYLLTQQDSITFLDIRLRVNASVPLIGRVLRDMGLNERVVASPGRGGKRVYFERA